MPKKKSKDAANLEAHQGAESKAEADISSQSNESSESNSNFLPVGSEILKNSDSHDFQNQEIKVPEENSSLQVEKEEQKAPIIESPEIPQEEEKQNESSESNSNLLAGGSEILKHDDSSDLQNQKEVSEANSSLQVEKEEQKAPIIENPKIPQEEEKQNESSESNSNLLAGESEILKHNDSSDLQNQKEVSEANSSLQIKKEEEKAPTIAKAEISKEEEKQPVIEKPEITKAKEFLAEPSNTLKTRLSSLFQRVWQVLPILSIGLAAAVGAGLYFLRRSNQLILAGIASTMLFSEIVRRWFNNRQEGSTNDECKANINAQANASKKDLPMDSVEGSPSYLPLHSKEGSPDASASSSVVSSSKGITPGC